jgi:hypothetical protein
MWIFARKSVHRSPEDRIIKLSIFPFVIWPAYKLERQYRHDLWNIFNNFSRPHPNLGHSIPNQWKKVIPIDKQVRITVIRIGRSRNIGVDFAVSSMLTRELWNNPNCDHTGNDTINWVCCDPTVCYQWMKMRNENVNLTRKFVNRTIIVSMFKLNHELHDNCDGEFVVSSRFKWFLILNSQMVTIQLWNNPSCDDRAKEKANRICFSAIKFCRNSLPCHSTVCCQFITAASRINLLKEMIEHQKCRNWQSLSIVCCFSRLTFKPTDVGNGISIF